MLNKRIQNHKFGGPHGVRTRDRRIKSPSLYLTKLVARLAGRATPI